MITELIITLKYEGETQLDYHIAPLMHGILMENVQREYGEELHGNQLHPFSQSVSDIRSNQLNWRICTLTQEAKEEIIDRILLKDEFYLTYKDVVLSVKERKLRQISQDEMIQRYYFQDQPRRITVDFQTPASFKSGGRYMIMPDERLIFQSLIHKYNRSSSDTEIGCEELLEQIMQFVQIVKYRLRSVLFSMDGTRIPSFMGSVTFLIKGPQQLVNLLNLLLAYGEYTGVGIKTSLGMGRIKVEV